MLIVERGVQAGRVFMISSEVVKIGRSRKNELSLKGAEGVSRHHCTVEFSGTTATISDNDSRNGTLVNGVLLTGPCVLDDGDLIEISNEAIRYSAEGISSDGVYERETFRVDPAERAPRPLAAEGNGSMPEPPLTGDSAKDKVSPAHARAVTAAAVPNPLPSGFNGQATRTAMRLDLPEKEDDPEDGLSGFSYDESVAVPAAMKTELPLPDLDDEKLLVDQTELADPPPGFTSEAAPLESPDNTAISPIKSGNPKASVPVGKPQGISSPAKSRSFGWIATLLGVLTVCMLAAGFVLALDFVLNDGAGLTGLRSSLSKAIPELAPYIGVSNDATLPADQTQGPDDSAPSATPDAGAVAPIVDENAVDTADKKASPDGGPPDAGKELRKKNDAGEKLANAADEKTVDAGSKIVPEPKAPAQEVTQTPEPRTISAKRSGKVSSIKVKVGQSVAAGQTLLSSTSLSSRASRKIKALESEERALRGAAKEGRGRAKEDLAAVRKELKQYRAKAKSRRITSPFKGKVLKILVKRGTRISKKTPLVILTPTP